MQPAPLPGLTRGALVSVGALLLAAGGLKLLGGGLISPFTVLMFGIGAVLLVAGLVLPASRK